MNDSSTSREGFLPDGDVDVVVVGAGIAGLASAHRLAALGHDVLVVESSDRVGGVMRTDTTGGFLIERGPNSARPTPALLALVDELGIREETIESDPRAAAFVLFGGRLHAIPRGPGALLASRLLGARGTLRLLAEPFVPPRDSSGEESVAAFARRRLGRAAAERIVAPFVSGIHAGDPEALGVRAAFPALAALEAEHGSLVRGLLARARDGRREGGARATGGRIAPPSGPISFRRGLGALAEALAARIPRGVRTGCEARAVERRIDGRGRASFRVACVHAGREAGIGCRELVIATPAPAAAGLVRPLSAELAGLLAKTAYAPLAIVHLALELSDLARPLAGFGFLTTPAERPPILACLWSSSLFPDRAPAREVLLTAFVGGTLAPERVDVADGPLADRAAQAVRAALETRRRPRVLAITRWKRAIPQYDLEHAARMRRVEEILARTEGLGLAGSHLHGISTSDCIDDGERVAREVALALGGGAGTAPATAPSAAPDHAWTAAESRDAPWARP